MRFHLFHNFDFVILVYFQCVEDFDLAVFVLVAHELLLVSFESRSVESFEQIDVELNGFSLEFRGFARVFLFNFKLNFDLRLSCGKNDGSLL